MDRAGARPLPADSKHAASTQFAEGWLSGVQAVVYNPLNALVA